MENAEEGIFLINTSGVMQYFNQAGEEMLGYEPGKLVGVPLKHLVAPEDFGLAIAKALVDDYGGKV